MICNKFFSPLPSDEQIPIKTFLAARARYQNARWRKVESWLFARAALPRVFVKIINY
jgi:hypothetical protein